MRGTKIQTIGGGLVAAAIMYLAMAPWADAKAACGAYVNGLPMSVSWCRTATQIYGHVMPGRYLADDRGNWVNLDTGHSGNVYVDAQYAQGRGGSNGGGGGGGSGRWTNTTIDPSGGCEGGSCVNILD